MNQPPYSQQPPGWGPPQRPGGGGTPPPQQPGWGAPPPQPPRKRKTGKIVGLGCLGVLLLAVLISIVAVLAVNSGDSGSKKDGVTPNDTSSASPESSPPKGEGEKSQADVFKECVAKKGTPTEKEAVKHVTKVTGADNQNDILDTAEVFTDYTGSIAGPHASDGKLIASAFASCYESDNGLVTVYDRTGEILSNGNF